MNVKDAIRRTTDMSFMITRSYVEDLGDRDLLVRSVPGSNHIAWQLGHLITSTQHMLEGIGRKPNDVPAGFEASYTKEMSASDDPKRFATKAQYVAMIDQAKDAILAAVDVTPETDMDKPGPESMREYAPTVGDVLLLTGQHWLMHAGQFVPIRRKLGKPALM